MLIDGDTKEATLGRHVIIPPLWQPFYEETHIPAALHVETHFSARASGELSTVAT